MKSDDIIAEFLRLAAASCSSFTEDIALQIEMQLRNKYGGTEPGYIAKTPSSVEKAKEAAAAEARRSGRVRATAEKHGISRATMYRILNRERKSSG